VSRLYQRGPLVDLVLAHLNAGIATASIDLLVGDGTAPKDGGWTKGQPGTGTCRPYLVLTDVGASPRPFGDAVRDQDTSWSQNYSVRYCGGSRQQAHWAGDHSRASLQDLQKTVVAIPASWKIVRIMYASLGPVMRNDSIDPPLWEGSDSVTLWLNLGT
jgi:hypothetical protein